MKKVVIMNAVPTNNGDAALVMGLRNKLISRGYEVAVSTTKYNTVKKLYPEVTWGKADYEFTPMYYRIFRIFPKLKKYVLQRRVRHNKLYEGADLIIGAPGGYINSYYKIEDKLFCMKLVKELQGSKVVMYSQSVGPLEEEEKVILDRYMDIFDLFMVRDDISYDNVKQYSNTIKTNDAAFLLDSRSSGQKEKKGIIAVSVREWNYDNRSREQYISLMKALVEYCIKKGNQVEFLSTCQGVPRYTDDSKMAQEIATVLEPSDRDRVRVDTKYHTLNELREMLHNYDFIIGTRLHMCILSMLAGIPAMNISYEVKGKECYRMLGLERYSVDYNSDIRESVEVLRNFMDNIDDLRLEYKKRIADMNRESNKYFDVMVTKLLEK